MLFLKYVQNNETKLQQIFHTTKFFFKKNRIPKDFEDSIGFNRASAVERQPDETLGTGWWKGVFWTKPSYFNTAKLQKLFESTKYFG